MRISQLSIEAGDGIRKFCRDVLKDEMCADDLSSTEGWAWLWFELRVAADNPAWFPKGKWATLQFMAEKLEQEAKEQIGLVGTVWKV